MNTPDSPMDLIVAADGTTRLNMQLELYLYHHPDTKHRALIEKAIACKNDAAKMQLLSILCVYG